MRKRLAIIATHPIQYQAPVWRALARMPELEVHVFFGSDLSVRGYRDPEFGVDVKWDIPLTDGFTHTFLSTDLRVQNIKNLRPVGLREHLRCFKPDAVLLNGCLPFFWVESLFAARLLGIPVFLRAEATDAADPRNILKNCLRDLFYSFLYLQFAGCLAIGQNARKHYLAKGVASEKIGWSPYCVDTELIRRQVEKYSPQRQRLEMGFSESDVILIYSGKLISKKSPLTLAYALQGLDESQCRNICLIVMGDGELRTRMETECRKVLGDRVHFTGFVNQSQIGKYYAVADILVLPSAWGETWGLVVNEALQFGIPAIVSDRVGCAPDLIIENETGCIFRAGDAGALRMCLLKLMSKTRQSPAIIKERCRDQMGRYSVTAAADGIRDAVIAN